MDKHKSVWILQMMKYFMVTKDYLQVNVVSDDPTGIYKNHFWLVSRSNVKYPIIHISDSSDQQRNINIESYKETENKIRNLVNNQQGEVLDISINESATDYNLDHIQFVRVVPNGAVNDSVAQEFPQLSTVVFDVSEPEKEINKLNKDISSQLFKKQKAVRKQYSRSYFKENMCVSFIVPFIICLIIYGAVHLISYLTDCSLASSAIISGAYYKTFISALHQYYRLFTGGFVHVQFFHLLANMLALFSMAKQVEKNYSANKSLIILCLSIVVGNVFLFAFGKNVLAVGISSGIYGLFAALTIAYISKGYFKNPLFRQSYMRVVFINIMISLLPNVSFYGHFGGLVCGLVLGVLFNKEKNITKVLKINAAVCGLIIAVFLGYFSYQNRQVIEFYKGEDMSVVQTYQKLGLTKLSYRIYDNLLDYYAGE